MTTQWSVVLEAQGESSVAEAALEKLCRTYWQPLYAYVRRQDCSIEEAQDITQAFFARVLERKDLNAVRREKGRLRSYLLSALKHFLINERHRAHAMKRGEGRQLIPLHELTAAAEPVATSTATAELAYERRWALTLLATVMARLQSEYQQLGNTQLFRCFKSFLADDPQRLSQAEAAKELGMNENAVKQAFHRFRRRYQILLREEIANTVAVPGDVEHELRHLIAVLRE